MLILGINSGSHDACACLFEEYRMLAAVPLERVTRKKGDGGRIPVEAMRTANLSVDRDEQKATPTDAARALAGKLGL